MADWLDSNTDRARSNAAMRRKRHIPWPEQREFFERHREEFGDLWALAIKRAKSGFVRYRDDAFWYNAEELQQMKDEEDADSAVYSCLLEHQDEINGLRNL